MSYIVKAGTPAPRFFDPNVTGAADPRGLYTWSAFYAPLALIDPDDGSIDADSSLVGQAVELLLFTSDIPIIARSYVFDEDTFQTNTAAIRNRLTLNANFVADTEGGGGPVTISNYGQVLSGWSGATQEVAVSGFPASIYGGVVPPLGTTVANNTVMAGAATSVGIEVIANGSVSSGVVGQGFYGKPQWQSTTAPVPVILYFADYTAAIRDAGNLFADSNGNLSQVVGLYATIR